MKQLHYPTLGETWLAILHEVYHKGEIVGGETRELLHLSVSYQQGEFETDPLLVRFASRHDVEEMHKVFFTKEPNRFGHNYYERMRGPRGQNDLSDIIELLRITPWSERAVVTLTGSSNGKVPCINVIHFLRRRGGLFATYFARGQDIFRKFHADGVCLYEMAHHVATELEIPLLQVSGIISSAHIYLSDLAEIHDVLEEAKIFQPATTQQEGLR